MRKIFLLILFSFVFIGLISAQRRIVEDLPALAIRTGLVEQIGRNFIEIRDESDQRIHRLTYFPGKEEIKVGERVRIHYDPRYAVVEMIKHMTQVEYHKDGQNLGYILKKP